MVFLPEFGLEHLLASDNRAFVFVLDNFDVFLLMFPEQFFCGGHFGAGTTLLVSSTSTEVPTTYVTYQSENLHLKMFSGCSESWWVLRWSLVKKNLSHLLQSILISECRSAMWERNHFWFKLECPRSYFQQMTLINQSFHLS